MAVSGTISVKAVGKILDAASGRGVSPAELCRAVSLDPAALEDPDGRIPYAQVVALYEEGARLTGDDAFGLHVGERTSLRVFDVLGYVLMNSPTLGEGLRRAVRYHSIWSTGADYDLDAAGGRARVGYRYLGADGDGCRQDCEMSLSIIVKFGRAATGVDWSPLEVCFRHAEPADTSEHRRIFRCPVRFSRPANEVAFDASLLALPLVGADPALSTVLERQAEEMLARLPRRQATGERVRQEIFQTLRAGGDAGLEKVARRLGLSARTLQRKLRDEGTSHQSLLDEIRRELSERYLREREMAIGEVAYLLGFSESSAFHRAFRRWTGLTPAEFRRANA
ncbi:MAG TPA: AraC family transcriptional regulator [Pyrinomonadaceae bacterium]|jgi:AraC-like DNA-binding protein